MKDDTSFHDFAECSCGHYGCGICNGKIRICIRCDGANHSLTTTCCGYRLTPEQRDSIHKGKLNYYQGSWHTL